MGCKILDIQMSNINYNRILSAAAASEIRRMADEDIRRMRVKQIKVRDASKSASKPDMCVSANGSPYQ